MKRKILHVIDHTGEGGAQVFLYQSVRKLLHDYDFLVAVLGREGVFSDKLRALGIPVFALGKRMRRWNPVSVITLHRLIVKEKVDLIHVHLLKSYIVGVVAGVGTQCKVVLHDHMGIYGVSLRHLIKSCCFITCYVTVFKRVLRYCDHCIVLTYLTAEYYCNHYHMQQTQVTVLPNAVDGTLFESTAQRPAVPELLMQSGFQTKKVIMVARLAPEKDWDTFLAVVRLVNKKLTIPCDFLIVGTGPEEARLRTIVGLQHINGVRFLGYRDDVPLLLSNSDVFLLTSTREPFGIVALEAMAARCPVVAVRSEGPQSYIVHGKNGYMAEAGDVERLAAHVLTLLTNRTIADRITKEAKKDVETKYTLTLQSDRLVHVYEKVLVS